MLTASATRAVAVAARPRVTHTAELAEEDGNPHRDAKVLFRGYFVGGLRHLRTAGPTPAPLLVNVKQACRMLGISRTTLYHLVRRGEVKQLRIGSAVRYSIDHLREFANSAQKVEQ
jgi:excisionase family DNA binding protein